MTSFHSTEATQVTNITLNVKDLNKMTEFYLYCARIYN